MKVFFVFACMLVILAPYIGYAGLHCEDVHRQLFSKSTPLEEQIQQALLENRQIFSLEKDLSAVYLVLSFGSYKMRLGALNELSLETKFFHWGAMEEHQSLVTVGSLSQQAIRDRINGRDRAGGGFYVSLSPIDSVTFGSHLTMGTIQRPVLEVPKAVYNKILSLAELERVPIEKLELISRMRAELNRQFIQLGIGFIEINTTWKVLLHENAAAQLATPTVEQVNMAIQSLPPPSPRVIQLFLEHEIPDYLQPIQQQLNISTQQR